MDTHQPRVTVTHLASETTKALATPRRMTHEAPVHLRIRDTNSTPSLALFFDECRQVNRLCRAVQAQASIQELICLDSALMGSVQHVEERGGVLLVDIKGVQQLLQVRVFKLILKVWPRHLLLHRVTGTDPLRKACSSPVIMLELCTYGPYGAIAGYHRIIYILGTGFSANDLLKGIVTSFLWDCL